MKGRLYILSSGVGGVDYLTKEAYEALKESEVIVSYTKYIDDLGSLIKDKELYTSGMTKEMDRCLKAIDFAKSKKTTSIISNGDVNVFGMATLIVELIDEQNLWDEIEVISIPGVTALLAAASKIGAPISQDFAVISLSDRLTDIDTINKRVRLALRADFVLGIYNPKSKTRIAPYQNFLDELKKVDKKIVIIASNIARADEQITVTDSFDLIDKGAKFSKITMSTLIIVGNSNTRLTKNLSVLTPRGYLDKYKLKD